MEEAVKKSKFTLEDHDSAKYWHPTLNGNVTPADVARQSNKRIWFRHDVCGHDFQLQPYANLKRDEFRCPFCVIPVKRLCGVESCKTCFARSMAPFLTDEMRWHNTKNEDMKPWNISKSSDKLVWIFHTVCGHSFEKSAFDVTKCRVGNGCAFCTKSVLCGDESCRVCFDKSLASLELEVTWLVNENAPIRAIDVAKHCSKLFWFYHKACGHSFQKSAVSFTLSDWSGCPYCSPVSCTFCGDDKCKHCFDRSIASLDIPALFWHPTRNEPLKAFSVAKGSSTTLWFKCRLCGHDTNQIVYSVMKAKSCPHCSQHWHHCGVKDCEPCKLRSIMSLPEVKYLSTKNPEDIWMLALNSEKRVIFDCPHCHKDYVAEVKSVYLKSWCPCKKRRTEAKLYSFLCETFPLAVIKKEARFDWCRYKNPLPFDFCINDTVAVELDGDHHFRDIAYWKSSADERQAKDVFKMEAAL